jgi:CDP-4-dehydro-6-deoxyglucose reductase
MSYRVYLAGEDVEFSCEEGQSILDAALNKGITISYGCRNGLCGSCKGQLLSGKIEYPEGQPGGISQAEIDSGEALFCKAVAQSDITIKVTVIEPEPEIEVKTLPAKVKQIDYLSDDVVRLILQLPAVEPFNFRAGQWVYFVLKDGRKRAFSIANAPTEKNEVELQVRHAIGGVFTDFVFNDLKVGALLRIEGPHGTFYFQQNDRPILLVAGGTGFAPIKGILEEVSQLGLKQSIHLFWGSRAKKDLYQENLVQQWVKDLGIKYTPVLSDANEKDEWQGETGFVHQAVIKAYPEMSDYAVYMAGPPQMIESCKQSFNAAGLQQQQLYYDSFDYSSDALDAMKGK